MVDAIVSVFLDKVVTALEEENRGLKELKPQLEKLRNELQFMQSFLKDAERLKRKKETLRIAMVGLRELIYEAEDILADCKLRFAPVDQSSSVCFSSPWKLPFQRQAAKRLRQINDKISDIKLNIRSYLPNGGGTSTMASDDQMPPRWSSPVYDHTQVVGLEDDTQKIKDWLFQADQGILCIGIVGMGGLGKTTTAQEVFNSKQVEEWFERRIWVSVSQTFTEEQIMRSMLRNLGDASVGDDRGELLKKINQYLQDKRYLIVMDDVWGEKYDWWKRIYEGLPKGKGSSVIITTRIEKVARMMGVNEERTHRPKFLSEDNSWLLFRKIAFAATQGECSDRDLERKGKDIVDKCKGLPLAIKAVGGMMLCKPKSYHEWSRIADHFRDELAENDDSVMASLQLSYDELPSYLKSCFLCFSLYPEDCVVEKTQLVHWWIGEGFVPVRNGRLSVEAGEDCFSGLTNRCLIEIVDKTYNGTTYTCKIHDLVRDLVIKMAKDDAFSGLDNASTRHLGLKDDMDRKHIMGNQKLRALLSTTKTGEVNQIVSNIAGNFCECRYLRVLDLSKSIFNRSVPSLLERIGSLQHLTYISLSNTHPLIHIPSSLQRLGNLEILDLSYCQNLKDLPPYIMSLEKLTVLDISHCGSLEYLPKGLRRLSNLQVLLGFRPARASQSRGSRISELSSLLKLRTLGLQLTWGDEIGDNEIDSLIELKKLQVLKISCFGSYGDDLTNNLNKLSPPQELQELSLEFYPGETSPTWLNPISLPMLRNLSITSGNLTTMNTSFWGNGFVSWKIEGLMLECLSDLELEWSAMNQAMPCLRTLNVSWSPGLESFPIKDVGFRGGVWKKD